MKVTKSNKDVSDMYDLVRRNSSQCVFTLNPAQRRTLSNLKTRPLCHLCKRRFQTSCEGRH